jgi:hypothetical protein
MLTGTPDELRAQLGSGHAAIVAAIEPGQSVPLVG